MVFQRIVQLRRKRLRLIRSAARRLACAAPTALAVAAAAWLAGCTYTGGLETPGVTKLAWFSYLNGDDIRAACGPDAPLHYRLVRNGGYNEQLRAYEVVGDGAQGAYLTARVQEGSGIPIARLTLADIKGPAGWVRSQRRLDAAALDRLDAALASSGAFGAPPEGLRLASEQFYWIFVGCRAGKVYFNAWLYPSPRFERLRFPELLLRYDDTGIPPNPLRAVSPLLQARQGGRSEDRPPSFNLQVGAEGLVGLARLPKL